MELDLETLESGGGGIPRMRAAARDDYAEFGRLAAPQPFSGGDDARHPRGTGGRVAVVHGASGNLTAARARRADFPAEFRARLHREPCHPGGRLSLAMAEALLGPQEEAVRLAEKATQLLPEARDAWAGARNLALAAEIFAWTRRPTSIWRVPNRRPVMATGLRPTRGVERHWGSV